MNGSGRAGSGGVRRPAASEGLTGLPLLRGQPLVAPLVVERIRGDGPGGVGADGLAGALDRALAGIGAPLARLPGEVEHRDRLSGVVLPAEHVTKRRRAG